MERFDPRKTMRELYNPPAGEISVVEVPAMNFVMVDGTGNPSTAREFQEATEAVFSLSYTVKFMLKKRGGGMDYAVSPLEGLWWAENMAEFSVGAKDLWLWTLMIMQPDFVTEDDVRQAVTELTRRKNPPALPRVRFERFPEGLSAQILHVGPFSTEDQPVGRLHSFIAESGRQLSGKHHEIYLSDFWKTAPEKLRTVIRQPMR